jgi:ABC-2 type transport system ATP-binding protein
MEETVVKIEHLSHRYTKNWAIRDINIEIGRRGIVGLLGSNGAGKSTTMNILCGSLNQTEVNVFIKGINMREAPEKAKKEIGFLSQTPPLYLDLTVDEYLNYCASLRLMPKDKIATAVKADTMDAFNNYVEPCHSACRQQSLYSTNPFVGVVLQPTLATKPLGRIAK